MHARVRTSLCDINEERLKSTSENQSTGTESHQSKSGYHAEGSSRWLCEHCVKEFKRLDILVNNAAYIHYAPFLNYDVEEWDKVVAVCLRGTFLCSQAAAQEMIKNRYGRIINIASVAGQLGVPMGSAYCTVKGGIIAFTKLLAVELAAFGVHANSISPEQWTRKI